MDSLIMGYRRGIGGANSKSNHSGSALEMTIANNEREVVLPSEVWSGGIGNVGGFSCNHTVPGRRDHSESERIILGIKTAQRYIRRAVGRHRIGGRRSNGGRVRIRDDN